MRKSTKARGDVQPKPEGQGSETYARYREAFGNLIASAPTNERLKEIFEEQGYVPVTQDNVAIEAGLDRKAISGAKARYSLLAAEIKAYRPTMGVKPTTTAKLGSLAADLAAARQMIVVLRSKAADAIIRADGYKTELKEARGESDRLRDQLAKSKPTSAGRR